MAVVTAIITTVVMVVVTAVVSAVDAQFVYGCVIEDTAAHKTRSLFGQHAKQKARSRKSLKQQNCLIFQGKYPTCKFKGLKLEKSNMKQTFGSLIVRYR